MADTPRLLASLQTLLADNASGDISPQDIRDFLVSAVPNGRSTTQSVASNDVSDFQKAQADNVCDAVDDDVQIQTAIDAAPSVGSGHE